MSYICVLRQSFFGIVDSKKVIKIDSTKYIIDTMMRYKNIYPKFNNKYTQFTVIAVKHNDISCYELEEILKRSMIKYNCPYQNQIYKDMGDDGFCEMDDKFEKLRRVLTKLNVTYTVTKLDINKCLQQEPKDNYSNYLEEMDQKQKIVYDDIKINKYVEIINS